MDSGIDFRMPLGRLGYTEQGIDFGKHDLERAALPQHLEIDVRREFSERLFGFLPDTFRLQRARFPGLHQPLHQAHRRRRHGEAESLEPCRKPRHPEYAQRVLRERFGHVPQQALFQVPAAAVGIDQRPVLVPRHGVDGEVATSQVLLQRDRGGGVEGEAVIAGPDLALGPRERTLVAGFRMQEHRKVLAHLPVAQAQQLLGPRTHHDPIALADGDVQQRIPDGAADFVDFHGWMIS